MATMPERSAAYAEYERLLRELHALYLRGADDGSMADEIRERMDDPWYAMTDEERELTGRLSMDLYAESVREEDR